MLLAADNMVNVAGNLYVRSGIQGLFGGSAPSSSSSSSGSFGSSSSSSEYIDTGQTYYTVPPSSSYPLCTLEDDNGYTWSIFTFGGRLFKTLQASASYTELLDTNKNPYSLNSPIVDAVVMNEWAYIADAAHDLIRVGLNGGFPAYRMVAPAVTPIVAGTNTPLDMLGTTANWSGYPALNSPMALSGYQLITGSLWSHASRSASDPPPIGSTTFGGTSDFGGSATIPAGTYYENQPNDNIIQGVDWEVQAPTYMTILYTYSDLVSTAAAPSLLSSTLRPFILQDEGRIITLPTGIGSHFIPGSYTIESVLSGVATLNNSCCTTDSSGGAGYLYTLDNTIASAAVYQGSLSYRSVNGNTGNLDAILFAELSANVRTTSPIFYPTILYNDLVIAGSQTENPTGEPSYTASILSSAGRPFVTADVSRVLNVQSSTGGWTAQQVTIIALSGSNAIVNGSCGTVGSTAGVGILGLEPGGTAWGNNNFTLVPPNGPKAAITSIDNQIQVNPSSTPQTWTGYYSFSSIPLTFDWLRYRVQGAPAPAVLGMSLPQLTAVDVRLVPNVVSGTLHVGANNVPGGWYLAGNWVRRNYTAENGGTPVAPISTVGVTDLAIGTNPLTVSSASYTFVSGDVNRFLIITGSQPGFTDGRYTIKSVAAGVATLNLAAGTASSTGGTAFMLEAGTPDYSTQEFIAIPYSSPLPAGTITWRLGFQLAGTNPSNIVWTSYATQVSDSAGQYLTVDISTVPSTILSGAQYLYLQIVNDLTDSVDLTNLATFGAISAAGNFSVNTADYYWYVTETAVIDPYNQIQSNPSPPTLTFTPSMVQAQADITLPAGYPQNAVTTEYNFWRIGGVWSDPRLIATVPVNADVAYGSDPLNPYYSWNHTTKTLLDNTPDIFLAVATLMSFSRDPMPTNINALTEYNGRLFAAVGNIIYVSWLYNSDNSAPLYTTLVLNLDDPDYPIEGANFPVSSDVTDTVVRMVPYGTPVQAANEFGGGLAVYCKRSVWLLQGTNSSNFSLQQYPYTPGVGLIAFHGVTRIDADRMAFMGPDRLHLFPPQNDSSSKDPGLPIQPQLYPVPPQTLQNQVAFSKSWMVFHDQKIFLGCPIPEGSANTVAWVYDLRVGGWTRWTGPAAGGAFPLAGLQITGAMSLPPNNNGAQYDLYLYGIDGQIYRYTGTVDRYTPLSASAAIPWVVTVHCLRPGFFYRYKLRPLFYMWARLEWFEVEMVMNGTLTMVAQAYNVGTSAPVPIVPAKSTQTYGLVGGGRTFRMGLPPALIEGSYITLTLSGSVTDTAYLRGVRGFVSGTSYEQGS